MKSPLWSLYRYSIKSIYVLWKRSYFFYRLIWEDSKKWKWTRRPNKGIIITVKINQNPERSPGDLLSLKLQWKIINWYWWENSQRSKMIKYFNIPHENFLVIKIYHIIIFISKSFRTIVLIFIVFSQHLAAVSSGFPQVSPDYLGTEMIQPGKSF